MSNGGSDESLSVTIGRMLQFMEGVSESLSDVRDDIKAVSGKLDIVVNDLHSAQQNTIRLEGRVDGLEGRVDGLSKRVTSAENKSNGLSDRLQKVILALVVVATAVQAAGMDVGMVVKILGGV